MSRDFVFFPQKHPADNLLGQETYRKWQCGTAGEKQAVVVIQVRGGGEGNSMGPATELLKFPDPLGTSMTRVGTVWLWLRSKIIIIIIIVIMLLWRSLEHREA